MKRFVLLISLIAGMGAVVFAQEAILPQLAVVEFSTNMNTEKAKADAITVRNLVESQMVGTRKYKIITRNDIDQLLKNQQIQVSSISSEDNIKKLKLQNISYIITGSVDAMGDDYAVTVRVLDVSSGQFSHSVNDLMGGSSRDLYNGINSLMTKFVAGMSADDSGVIVQGQGLVVNSTQFHLERGKVFFERNDSDNAISELNEAIKLDSKLAEAYAYRAGAYLNPNQKKFDQALSDANNAIRLNPNLAFAYFVRAAVYHNKSDFDRAIVDYTQFIRMEDPLGKFIVEAYFQRGHLYLNKKDYDRARSDFQAVLSIKPNDAELKKYLEDIMRQQR